MNKFDTIILAAGEGSRMRSKKPKVLHEVMNKPMISHVIDAVRESGTDKICIVVGHKADIVKDSIGNAGIEYVLQEERLGTGHAVKMAIDFVEEDRNIVILCGDTPLVKGETIKKLIDFHIKEDNSVTVISALVDDPKGYGHIIRGCEKEFVKSVEDKDCTEEEKLVKEINTGVYCFKSSELKYSIDKLNNNNTQKEYYLPDVLEIIKNKGGRVNAVISDDVEEFFGVNSRRQLAKAAEIMRIRINEYHMDQGVTLIDPRSTYIGDEVKIGMDTVIHPGVIIEGKTAIGDDCVIGPGTRITDMIIGDGVIMSHVVAIQSQIGNNSIIGPFAYIRPNCVIGDNVKIGDFVEVKNSNIGNETKIPHLTYIGDTDAGNRINFGCGTITVNYDGVKKYRTVVNDNAFIGCNANLVAPVEIDEGAYIAAGSTITKNVPKKALAIARNRQQNIEGWSEKR